VSVHPSQQLSTHCWSMDLGDSHNTATSLLAFQSSQCLPSQPRVSQWFVATHTHTHNCFNRMRLRRRCKHFRCWIEWRTTLSHASTSTMASERRYIYWSPARCALYLLRACGSAGLIDLLISIDLIIKHFFLSFLCFVLFCFVLFRF
jgi:hypothetical protein